MFYKDFLNKFCLGTGYSQKDINSFIDSFLVLDMRNLSEERKNKLWMPKSSYHVDLGRPEISIGLNLDDEKNIIMASVMTDFKYQSKNGESDFWFFIWIEPGYKKYLNIDKDIVYSNKYKQNIHGLFFVSNIDDLLKTSILIANNKDIEYLDSMQTSVEMATRIMIRRCQKTLECSDFQYNMNIPEMSKEHVLWMCETLLTHRYPVDKMNRWLGYIQAVLIMQRLFNVNDERNFSRPIFHMAYRTECLDIPASLR
jgi:hypothetical protein